MDVTTLVGIAVAISCILVGQTLEGGHASSLGQLAAALIVIGGTTGAVITQFPLPELRRAVAQMRFVVVNLRDDSAELVPRFADLARRSRKEGLLALEKVAADTQDPFLKHALLSLIDGNDAATLRGILESAVQYDEARKEVGPRLLEAAGGYAPTVGILGAVLGLIHVMENLSDPLRLGAGIAVAFVATVYGVGAANLVLLPLASKLKLKLDSEVRRKEMIIEGVCAIQEGVNPQAIQKRLASFLEAPAEAR